MSGDAPREQAKWAPCVYGRTRHVDQWWRAVPETGIDQWLKDVVHAAVAGGRGLRPDNDPRFTLARGRTRTLVAVACAASSISASRNVDGGGRSLYTLIGWIAEDPAAPVPGLAELSENALRWAADEYDRWVAPNWDAEQAPTTPTAATESPWTGPSKPVPAEPLKIRHRRALIVSLAQAERLWETARKSKAPITVTTGWTRRVHADMQTLTGAAAADVQSPILLKRGPLAALKSTINHAIGRIKNFAHISPSR